MSDRVTRLFDKIDLRWEFRALFVDSQSNQLMHIIGNICFVYGKSKRHISQSSSANCRYDNSTGDQLYL